MNCFIEGLRPRRVHHPRGEPLRRDGGDRVPERAAGAARVEAVHARAAAGAKARAEAVQAVQGGAQQRAHVHLPPQAQGHPTRADLQAAGLPGRITAPNGEQETVKSNGNLTVYT